MKKQYQELLEKHVAELSALQHLHYASDSYALLLIFQTICGSCERSARLVRGCGR